MTTYCGASGSLGPVSINCSSVGPHGSGCRWLLRVPLGFAAAFLTELGLLGRGLFVLSQVLQSALEESDLNQC